MSLIPMLLGVLVSLVALVGVSHIVEALRSAPKSPDSLADGGDIPFRYTDIEGVRIRYIKTGSGPTLLLLHTLRTQLDLFEKIVPDLAAAFTVYALDYPGHGYSEIPKGRYDADFFVNAVEMFLNRLDLQDVTVCGVSIGGAIALILAGRRNARVTRVVAVNPYDYAKGRGITRSSPLGWLITVAAETPLIAGTVMRLRTFAIMRAVLQGGVADPRTIRPALLKQLYDVGNRPGHYTSFISLLRNAATWQAATDIYRHIDVPVCLIWGSKDWSRLPEREHDRSLIPGARMITVDGGGHFLPLDRPRELTDLIVRFAASRQAQQM